MIKLEIQHHNLKNCQHGGTVKSPEAQNSAWGGRPLLCGFSHHKKNGETLDRNRWVAWFKVTSEIAIDSLLNHLSFALSWWFLFHLFICALFVLGVVVWSSVACLLPRAQGYSHHKCGPSQVPEDPALRVSLQHSRWSTHSNYQTKVLCPSQGKGSEARYFLFPWLEVPTHSGCMAPKSIAIPKQDVRNRSWVRDLFSVVCAQYNMAIVAWSVDPYQLWRWVAITWDKKAGGQKLVQGNQGHSRSWDHCRP